MESLVVLHYKPHKMTRHPYGGLPDVLARLRKDERAVLDSVATTQ